jgi:hypothetical protein
MIAPFASSPFPDIPFEAPVTYQRLTLDIETEDARPEDAEALLRTHWSPNPTWTNETIGKRFKEALEKKLDKLALIDAAPIAVVSLKSDTEAIVLHSVLEDPARTVGACKVEGFATQREMLLALRVVLDQHVDGTTELVGHNVIGFDLRRLRYAFAHEGLRIPRCLADRDQPVFDLMREFGRRFSMAGEADGKLFCALDVVLAGLGIRSHKGDIDGSMVPELVRRARAGERKALDILITYAALDAVSEEEAYLRMTGQAEDRG